MCALMDRRVVGESCFYSSSPRWGRESLSQDPQYVRVHRLCLGSVNVELPWAAPLGFALVFNVQSP